MQPRSLEMQPDSMASLLLRAALPDVADMVYEVSDESWMFGVFLCVFILFASLTVMNMLVGVLCEVVSVVSSVEKEQLVVNFVQTQLRSLLHHCVGDADKDMSKEEFIDLLGFPQAARALHEVGVDVLGLMEIADFLFKDEKKLTFPDFMEMVLELRGTNTATVKNIVDLQRFVHLELRKSQVSLQKQLVKMMESKDGSHVEARIDDAVMMEKRSFIPDPGSGGGIFGFGGGGTSSMNFSKNYTKKVRK